MRLESARGLEITFEPAGIGHRVGAYLIDALVLLLVWVFFLVLLLLTVDIWDRFDWLSDWVVVIFLLLVSFLHVGYWFVQEGFQNGQTLGKRAMSLRVMDQSGKPIAPWQAGVRTLLRTVDFLPMFYGVGVFLLAIGKEPRRLGDWAAGTVVVLERRVDLAAYTAERETELVTPDMAELLAEAMPASADYRETVADFLSRAHDLDATAKRQLAERLADPVLLRLAERSIDVPRLRREGIPDAETLLRVLAALPNRKREPA